MIKSKLKSLVCVVGVVVAGVVVAAAVGANAASAEVSCESCTQWLRLSSSSFPKNLRPGGEGEIMVVAEDRGDAPLNSSSPMMMRAKLPAGLTATKVALGAGGAEPSEFLGIAFCAVQPSEVICTVPAEYVPLFYPTAFSYVDMLIRVAIAETAESGELEASASGGGSPAESIRRPLTVSAAPTRFGVDQYELRPENADGSPDTQAGSHPFQLTTVLALNQGAEARYPPESVKDLRFNLPPGVIADATHFPECPLSKFAYSATGCPDNTAVGVASASLALPVGGGSLDTVVVPVFLLVPSRGEPVRFAFSVVGVPVYIDTSVRTGSDYGVTVTVHNITEIAGFVSTRVTLWGVPGDPRHDSVRGWNCLLSGEGIAPCSPVGEQTPPPLLTLSTSCTGPVHTNVEADSWQEVGVFSRLEYTFKDNLGRPVGMDGCNQLPFSPSIRVTPDGREGSTPTGLTVDEHVPQATDLNPTGLAESAVKGLSVALPAGVALNPSAADGLQACSEEQIGLESAEPVACPEASKVAAVKITTPLLPNPLEGAAYLAEQDANPFGSLVGLYVYAEDPVSGVRAKAVGEVVENPVTGQLTAHFEGDPLFANDPRYAGEPEADFLPEDPFEDIELHFFGGDRAPLGMPASCGSYRTVGTFSPWSQAPPVESDSEFDVVSGPNGTPCSSPLPFDPSLAAGTTSIQAGGFSPLRVTMSRADGEQDLRAVQLHMPLGLSGTLSTVKLCGEEQADAGTCGPESEIGETIVSVGLGGDPYSVRGGRVYITGPYRGAPFGLSIVNPAKAGPFDLGKVVVRAKIEVDPVTAGLTITTDTEGPYKIPTIIDGIPLEIQHVSVLVNRPGFTFNPTDCEPLRLTGLLSSAEGATASVSDPFQATNCASLGFKPGFSVSTSAHTSRVEGASLHVNLTLPAVAGKGVEANVSQVKVSLPKRLPSPLTTLQKACLEQVFAKDPASCPVASQVGEASVSTPLLAGPLTGTAYFVSHGGAKFPELIIVLVGEDGVTVQVHGETFISKEGITSAKFNTVPDVPFTSFELTFPERKYPALTANGNLCKGTLSMPTEFVAQNGDKITQSTRIAVTGCPKSKATPHKKKRKVKKKRKRA